MKILPIMLINNVVEELQIIIHDCEKIIIERLICSYSNNSNVTDCTIYFNDVPLQYKKISDHSRKKVFYLDGITDNVRSFQIHSPCTLKFMLSIPGTPLEEAKLKELRFLLHLSLELTGRSIKKRQAAV